MSNWTTIDELRNIFIEKFTNSKLNSELEKACSEEYELMRDYNGRQILELLQNVDDAYGDKKMNSNINDDEVEILITYKNNILEVGNTGTSFTEETIERLCLGRASNKSSKNIGNKGTGFRSLLNDAEWIELYSKEFAIRFSLEFAKQNFEKYSDNDLIKRQKESWQKDYDLCFPIMNCPEKIDMIETDFDTLIRVKLTEENKSKDNSVAHQLNDSFYKSLLFLPNITKISVKTDTETWTAQKITDDIHVLIEMTKDNNKIPSEEYFLFNKDVNIHNKFASLSIAIPKDSNYNFQNEKLYCYFPIRNFQSPVNALIHAPFITNNSRDDIPSDNDEINKKIFYEILVFIKETAEKLTKPEYGDTAIKMVTQIEGNKLWDANGFNQNDEYLKLLSDVNILPTVNDDYISIRDNPNLFKHIFPSEFKGEEFKLLLKYQESVKNTAFIEKLATYIGYDKLIFSADILANKINLIGKDWDIPTQVRIFLWWSNHYPSSNIVPHLLLDTQKNWIQKTDRVFLPTDSGISELPDVWDWLDLCILPQDYVDELIQQIKNKDTEKWNILEERFKAENIGNKRLLAAFSRNNLSIEFTEQSSSELIIRAIHNQINSEDKSIAFINWFFENYKNKLAEGSELSKVPFNLPDEYGKIKPSSQLYLGEKYGNTLAKKLFSDTVYTALIEPNKLYQGNNIEEFKVFIQKCGVLRFPLIESMSLIGNSRFVKFISDKYSEEINFNINYLKSKSIESIEQIIRALETSEIIEWISKHEELRELLRSDRCDSNVTQNSNWYGFSFKSNEYIKYVLNATPWIKIDDKKYSPNQIVKYEKLGANVPNIYGISEQKLKNIVGEDVIQILDFRDSFAGFEDKEIKKILDALPSFDNGVISRKLYTEIIKHKKDIKPNFSPTDIKVLAKDGEFYSSKNVKYTDKKLPKSIESQGCFIDIPVKQNISTITNWLGVERFKTNLMIKSYKEMNFNQDEFNKEINNIKIAVLSTIDDNKENVNKIKKMHILPCSEVIAMDKEQNNRKVPLENFYFVDADRNFYLKLPNSKETIEHLRLSDDFSNAIVDIFEQILTLELDANLIENLVSKNIDKKREKISNEFGIDKWDESYKLLFGENEINNVVINYFSGNGLCENSITKLEEIDFSSSLKDFECEILINSLKQVKKDICNINNLSVIIKIDIRKYWQKKIENFLTTNKQVFEGKLFSNLIANGNIEEQNGFLSKLDDYKNYSISLNNITNSISFDFEQELHKIFPVFNDDIEIIDIVTAYQKNYDKINPENLFADEIANNREVQTMIYFNRIEDFKKWLIIQMEKNDTESSLNSKDIYKHFEGVIPEKRELEFHEPKENPSEKSNHHTGVYTRSSEDKINKAKKVKGNKAELVIYNLLCNQYGKENVFPESEAFVDLGILKPGQASSGEYDLSYTDESGKTFFVEVKSGDGKSFVITPGELEFAKNNTEYYKLFLVSEIESDLPKYEEISLPFWNDSRFRLKEVIERIEITY